jgi:hypothetical protein
MKDEQESLKKINFFKKISDYYYIFYMFCVIILKNPVWLAG